MIRGVKGQFVLVSVLAFVVTVIIFVGVYPALDAVITNFVSSTDDPVMVFLIRSVPFVVLLAVVMGLFSSINFARAGG